MKHGPVDDLCLQPMDRAQRVPFGNKRAVLCLGQDARCRRDGKESHQ